MVKSVTVRFERPIGSVQILKDYGTTANKGPAGPDEAISANEISRQAKSFTQATAALSAAAGKLNEFYEKEIQQHNQQIAKLAVEIARKILLQEVNDGHYKIEAILQEALRNAPSRENVIARINPADAAFCQQLQEKNTAGNFSGIRIVADANVKPAECVVETPRGLVESFIETHLQHIAEALAHAQ